MSYMISRQIVNDSTNTSTLYNKQFTMCLYSFKKTIQIRKTLQNTFNEYRRGRGQ